MWSYLQAIRCLGRKEDIVTPPHVVWVGRRYDPDAIHLHRYTCQLGLAVGHRQEFADHHHGENISSFLL